jgi:endonuclease YncB( thermonuclease family)
MIGLVVVMGLIIVYFAAAIEITKAYGQSEETIRLQSIQTPEQKVDVEKVKEQWLTDFNQLLKETQQYSEEAPTEN